MKLDGHFTAEDLDHFWVLVFWFVLLIKEKMEAINMDACAIEFLKNIYHRYSCSASRMWCKIKHKDDFVFITNIFYFDFMVTKKTKKNKNITIVYFDPKIYLLYLNKMHVINSTHVPSNLYIFGLKFRCFIRFETTAALI